MNLRGVFPRVLSHQTGSSCLLADDGKWKHWPASVPAFVNLGKLHKGSVELCQLVRGKVGSSLKDITAISKYCTLKNSGTGQILFPGDAAGILSFDTFPTTLEFKKSVPVSHIWELLLTWPNQNTWLWEKKEREKETLYMLYTDESHTQESYKSYDIS